METYIVTVNKLNKRKFPVSDFSDKSNIAGQVLKDFTFQGEEATGLANALGKWIKDRDGYYYWGGGVMAGKQNNSQKMKTNDIVKYPWWISDFGIDEIWKITKGDGVTVIILDSGFTAYDEVPNDKVNALNVDTIKDPSDSYFHGTLMSSIILGQGPEIFGVSPESKVISIKVTDNESMNANNLIQGLLKAESLIQENNHYVINCSLAISKELISLKEKELIESSLKRLNQHKNVIIVAAVGNASSTKKTIPSSVFGVVSCAGLMKSTKYIRLVDSNYWDSISITAPGDFPCKKINKIFHGRASSQGSSQASAFTSGLIALVLSKALRDNKNIDYSQILKILVDASDKVIEDDETYNILVKEKLQQTFIAI
jgi:subtilisin family serine protease